MQCKNKLAIFDLDGTLFDTKDVNYYSYKEALKEFNVELDYDFFCKECNGQKYSEFLPRIQNFSNDHLKVIHSVKNELYKKYISKARINSLLFYIIEGIRNEYYIALVTTASKQNVFELLDYFKKKQLFDIIITQEDVCYSKPNPEGFIKAIDYFHVKKEDVVIFEDSEIGIEAAKSVTNQYYIVKGFN